MPRSLFVLILWRPEKADKAGAAIADKLVKMNAEIANQEVIPDEPEVIGATLKKYAEQQLDLIIFTGVQGCLQETLHLNHCGLCSIEKFRV